MKLLPSSVLPTVVRFAILLTSINAFSNTEFVASETSLEQCRTAFTMGKNKGISSIEIEQAPNEEYSIEEKYRIQAQHDYKWSSLSRIFVSATTYGSIFALPVLYLSWNWRAAHPRATYAHLYTNIKDNIKTVGASISGSYFLANGLREPFEGLVGTAKSSIEYAFKWLNAYRTGIPLIEPWNAEIEIRAAEIKYRETRHKLPEAYRITIEDQFDKLRAQYVDHSVNRVSILPPKDDGMRKSVNRALKAIERISALPQELKPVKINETKLNELIANYPDAVQVKLKNFANAISYWSKPEQELSSRPFREVLYLQGASGTGKTYFAERFADVFYSDDFGKNNTAQGLPLIKISLEDVNDLRDFVGAPASRFDDQERKVSKLSYALSNLAKDKRYKNAIIVLDEADKFLNSEKAAEIRGYLTKEIFNLSTKKLKLHDLGVEVDISGFHFILIGNTPIYDASNAFMDRMTVVKFAAFSEDKRLNIACNDFGKGMSQLNHVPESDEYLKLIIEGVHKDQIQKPGVRTLLRTIGEFIDHLSNPENLKTDFPFLTRLGANAQIYSDPYGMFEMTVQNFERLKPSLSPSLQKSISNHLDKISKGKLLNEALRPNNNEDKKILETYLQNIGAMMSFPHEVRNLVSDEENINFKLEKLLRLYPTEVQDPIHDIVKLHISASQKDASFRDLSKNVVYLWGEPGTGKSYLAQGLAKALNLSLIELDFKGGKFGELFGEGFFDFMFSSPAKLSRFTQTFLNSDGKTPEKNAIIYINEIDKILNSTRGPESDNIKAMLLDILDPDKREFEVRDLRASIDLTRYLFVLVGNEKIKSDSEFSALDDRMTLIEFKGYSLESKLEIARKYFANLAKEAKVDIGSEEDAVIESLLTYSHVDKKQVSLRTPFKIIELYTNWLVKREGKFDHKAKLDIFSKDKKQ